MASEGLVWKGVREEEEEEKGRAMQCALRKRMRTLRVARQEGRDRRCFRRLSITVDVQTSMFGHRSLPPSLPPSLALSPPPPLSRIHTHTYTSSPSFCVFVCLCCEHHETKGSVNF